MTVSYQFNVATSTFFGFTKLLGKWRGSVYKLVYKEFLLYLTAYALISFSYRELMSDEQRRTFEKVAVHCVRYLDLIPLSFVLGFYVSYVVQRWWTQFTTIPWPDRLMNTLILYVDGTDERGRLVRRTLMRWWNLSFVMMMSSISIAVKKRFPTMDHLVEAGFMTEEERLRFNAIQAKVNKYFVPMCWFLRLLDQMKKEGRVKEGAPLKHILEELNETRTRMSLLWCHDWVTIPLVYTQVVTWVTHLFFVASLVGRQFLDPSQGYDDNDIDLYIPIFTFLQFFFYMGWLKVAEQLINPFGEDDDDFETNWLIDRHLTVSYLGVDELYLKTPALEKDLYWNNHELDVPYTSNTLIHRIPTYCGSTMHLKIPEREQHMVHPEELFPPEYQLPPRNFIEKVRDWFSCDNSAEHNRAFNLRTMWRETSISECGPTDDAESPKNNGVRTLGRKESLMAGEFLAMLNSGRKRGRIERVQSHHSFTHDYHPHSTPTGHEVSNVDYVPLHEKHLVPKFIGSHHRQESHESLRSKDGINGSHGMKLDSLHHGRDDVHLRHPPADRAARFSFTSEVEDDDVNKNHPLGRLSEVENETDADYSGPNTPLPSQQLQTVSEGADDDSNA
ncbi:hypothetical protein CHUAL_005193 [Chamberlinius hualienensis]